MCDIRFFKNAYNDYRVASELLKNAQVDEFYINTIAYHLQQLQMSRNNGSIAVITEWLENSVDMLTRWEAETRYNLDFTIEIEKLLKSYKKIGEFLNACGLSYELRKELKSNLMREKLIALLPECKKDCDIFELNCFYQIYRRRLAGR
ncbi:MAG: HEPN domain-containing protein [Lachnospiraceae bacterium]|nr:HEPN domain-containing protein [Lachnospiraceae bacterium]